MANWKELIKKENLTDNELKQIPGALCTNYITSRNYFVDFHGYESKDLLDGLDATDEEFNESKNWLHALDEQRFNLNVFRKSKTIFTHHDYYHAGVNFKFSDNNLFIIMVKLLSASKILKEISKTVRKFNNEYDITPVGFKKDSSHFILNDYPFYRSVSVGHECRFSEGVFASNFEIHNIKKYTTKHIICGKRLYNLVHLAYGHLNLKYKDDKQYIYINGEKIGEYVELQQELIGKQKVFTDKVIESSTKYNAVRIIKDFVYNNKTLFFKNEIYNAPYCLIYCKWNEPTVFKRFYDAVIAQFVLRKSVAEIEKQIEFSNLKIFETQEALSESERRLNLAEVYTKSSLVKIIESGGDPTKYEAKEAHLSVLFNDIREFTTLSETMSPKDVVEFLNNYFNRVNQ